MTKDLINFINHLMDLEVNLFKQSPLSADTYELEIHTNLSKYQRIK